MKLFKLLLASLALVAGSAQANSISTSVFSVDNSPTTDSVQYVLFNVTDGGLFDIRANSVDTCSFPFCDNSLSDPYIMLFSNTVSSGSLLTFDDDSGGDGNSLINNFNLNIGNYILAVSNYELTVAEAISRNNPGVTDQTEGNVRVTIDGGNYAAASFGHTNNPSAVPVPAAAWLFGSALLGFAGFRRKSV